MSAVNFSQFLFIKTLDPDPYRIRFRIETNTDPQHCFFVTFFPLDPVFKVFSVFIAPKVRIYEVFHYFASGILIQGVWELATRGSKINRNLITFEFRIHAGLQLFEYGTEIVIGKVHKIF